MLSKVNIEIIQLSREINAKGGVSGVSYNLEKEFKAFGYKSQRFDLKELFPSFWFKIKPRSLLLSKLKLMIEVIVYSIIGSFIFEKKYKKNPDLVSVCHGDVLNGDILINHGLHKKMLEDSGNKWRLFFRNPLHLFLWIRETFRHKGNYHTYIVCFSEYEKKVFVRYNPNKENKIKIIPNGVDTEKFSINNSSRNELRDKLLIHERDFCLIFVGHEYSRKGLRFLIESLVYLPGEVKLLVVGGENYLIHQYRDVANEQGVGNRVQFLGTREDIPELMNAADLFVLPSFYETWALVGLEAMACGTPALMTCVGGISDYLKNYVNGMYIKREARDIADKVKELMNNRRLLDAMAQNARQTALDYSWHRIAQQYLDLIHDVAEIKRANV